MPSVDSVYAADCPNLALSREHLRLAFAAAGLTPDWQEHRIGDPDGPERVRGFGSPTILVDGRDVTGATPEAESCCRLYDDNRGAPSVEDIAAALSAAAGPR